MNHLSKCPITDVADVWLFPGVSATVALEDVLLGEGHWTKVALERPLLAVYAAVLLEVRLLEEPLPTLRTHLITNLWINKTYTVL